MASTTPTSYGLLLTLTFPAVNSPATYQVGVVANNGSETAMASTTVTAYPSPQVAITPSATAICAGQSAQLTASGAATYTWNTQQTTASISVTATGPYSVTGITSAGCSGTAAASVTVNPPPTVTITPSATAVCAGQFATFAATPGLSSYKWSSGQTTSSISVSVAGPYSVTVTNGNGCSATAGASLTVNAPPTVTITPSATAVCAGQSATFTATPGLASYRWSSGQITSSIPASVAGPYSLTVTNTSGCTATVSASLTVNTLPTVSITPSATIICAGQRANLVASGADTYIWSTGVITASISVSVAGPYSVTGITTATGCSNTATANVTVTPLPNANFTGLPASVCVNAGAITLTPTTPGGIFSGPGIGGNSFNPATATAGGPYSITYTVSNQGCPSSSVQTVTVNPLPVAPLIATQTGHPYPAGVSSLTAYQNTGEVILTTTGCPAGTLSWNGGSSNTLSVSTAGTGTQTFTATCSQNGCTSPVATATVTVVAPILTVAHQDATFGQFNTNTIKPYLQLNDVGNIPIPYSQITLRYWLTVEGNRPITNLQTYSVQIGAQNMRLRYVPLVQPRQGATAYVEYSFDAAAGSLGAMSNSGPIQTGFLKDDYSAFNQADDYSYVTNRDYTLNAHITAYLNGQIVYGQEPIGLGSSPQTPLSVSLSATNTVFPTTDNTTLVAQAQGGSGQYSYIFSGPGSFSPTGNTAVVRGLPAGVQTFTVVVTDTSTLGVLMATATVSVTVTGPPNTPPVATANANQTATVGAGFTYTVNSFTDAETPNSLTYTATISPANNLSFNPATRLISGTPTSTGVSAVTVTATDPGGLSASTTFTITVSPAPVVSQAQLTVLHLDATFGQTNTNTIKPFLLLTNTGTTAIPYSAIKVRYYLTVEGGVPITNFQTYYVQLGAGNLHARYVALPSPVNGADAYIEYSFDAAAGSLAPGANSGAIQNGFIKQDYSAFDQSNDYSYALNRDYTPNNRITAYVNNSLVFGTPPAGAPARLGVEETPFLVQVLGNPVTGSAISVSVSGAAGQSLRFRLTDLNGRLVSERQVEKAGLVERQTLPLDGAAGLLLLQVRTDTQTQTVKVLKQ